MLPGPASARCASVKPKSTGENSLLYGFCGQGCARRRTRRAPPVVAHRPKLWPRRQPPPWPRARGAAARAPTRASWSAGTPYDCYGLPSYPRRGQRRRRAAHARRYCRFRACRCAALASASARWPAPPRRPRVACPVTQAVSTDRHVPGVGYQAQQFKLRSASLCRVSNLVHARVRGARRSYVVAPSGASRTQIYSFTTRSHSLKKFESLRQGPDSQIIKTYTLRTKLCFRF